MEDVFQTIEYITRSKERYREFFNPNLETSNPVIQVNEVSCGKAAQHHKSDHSNNGQPYPVQFNNTLRENTKGVHSGKIQDNNPTNTVLKSCVLLL